MSKCLVTKHKAVVDNPNLPDLGTIICSSELSSFETEEENLKKHSFKVFYYNKRMFLFTIMLNLLIHILNQLELLYSLITI